MLIYRQRSSVFRAAFPTYSIRVPRVTLSIQTGYTSTASRVDNDKQIPQLLFIVLSRCSTIVVLQQTQESAVAITSRNNSNPVATSIQSQHFKAQNDVVITNSNDVVTCHQLVLRHSKEPAADRTSKRCRIDPSTGLPADTKISRLISNLSSGC
ncbi:cell wall [Dorcoceras hygrometricum]|uniref:Cell wall n=1 Tax=Dorcoceras hygrometricum TaxID=472368 RepID=A0A2Z7C370_9LAMI|nr:cell wall [Dorcoceras hygrometricum]